MAGNNQSPRHHTPVQLVFLAMESAPEVAYGEAGCGHYQGQTGATPAFSDELFKTVKEENGNK